MELRQLRYFVAVAQTLNFSEASRRLFITQGTLSQQIRQLENEMGAQLFERTSHSVNLTEAGEELLPLAQQTIADSEACMDKMLDLRKAVTGTLNIGATQSMVSMMASAARSFMKDYPGVKLKLFTKPAAELLEMLYDKEVDLALAYKSIENIEGIESEELFSTSMGVVMRQDHPLAKKESFTLTELENWKIIIPGRGIQARLAVDHVTGLDTRKLNAQIETNDPALMLSMVHNTQLIALSSPFAIWDEANLVFKPLDNGIYKMSGCVHRLKNVYRKRSSEIFLEKLRIATRIEMLSRGM